MVSFASEEIALVVPTVQGAGSVLEQVEAIGEVCAGNRVLIRQSSKPN
jgi:hypothetical protein